MRSLVKFFGIVCGGMLVGDLVGYASVGLYKSVSFMGVDWTSFDWLVFLVVGCGIGFIVTWKLIDRLF